MDLGTYVVCFGHDPVLLESRRKVLATRFRAVSVSTLEALEETIASHPVELLVICHSVPEADCWAAVAMANHSPRAIQTVLLIFEQVPLYAPAHAIRVTDGPGAMLARLASLQRARRLATDHTESDPTTLLSSHPVLQPAEELHREVPPSKRRSDRPQT